MSKHESDDLEGLGYLLPEDSQFRLARLSDHIKFLARLAQPRTANESSEYTPEVRMGELTFCLEVLAEQLDLVLGEVSWPAQPLLTADAPEHEVISAARPEAADTNTGRFAFGVTADQIDTLDRLIRTISVHGDVVAASDTAELAGRTLALLGKAIHDGTAAVRELLDQVQAQRLGQGSGPRSGVGEERGVYAVELVYPTAAEQAGCNPARGLLARRSPRGFPAGRRLPSGRPPRGLPSGRNRRGLRPAGRLNRRAGEGTAN